MRTTGLMGNHLSLADTAMQTRAQRVPSQMLTTQGWSDVSGRPLAWSSTPSLYRRLTCFFRDCQKLLFPIGSEKKSEKNAKTTNQICSSLALIRLLFPSESVQCPILPSPWASGLPAPKPRAQKPAPAFSPVGLREALSPSLLGSCFDHFDFA